MKKLSEKTWNFIDEHKVTIFLFILIILSGLLRFSFFGIESGDYRHHLSHWFNALSEARRNCGNRSNYRKL